MISFAESPGRNKKAVGMSDDEELKFTCEQCGGEFDPDPEMMVEGGIGPECVSDENLKDLEATGIETLNRERLETMSDEDLEDFGLKPGDREKLLAGESIPFGMCICVECQDKMLADQEGSAE